MARFLRSLLTCLFLGLAGPVCAEREVHVIAVGQGYQTDNYYALPEAKVLVDRPGQDVGLVLLDDGKVHWTVETTAGTIVSEIVRSGQRSEISQVSLSGIPVVGMMDPGLPMVFHPWGRDFRTLVDAVAETWGTERIHSFHGTHKIGKETVRVDRVQPHAGLAQDYLSKQLGALADLPPKIRNWIEGDRVTQNFVVTFETAGIRLKGSADTQWFPVSPDVPDILLPVTGVYDAGGQVIYGLSYGAEGYLYSVDAMTGKWKVVTSLNGYDAAGLLFDPESRQLVTTGAFSRPGEIKVFGLDGRRSSTFVSTKDFPGLTDLFDYGNEHGPPLLPQLYSDGWLIVQAQAGLSGVDPDIGDFRIYAVQIDTGEVRLLRFHND